MQDQAQLMSIMLGLLGFFHLFNELMETLLIIFLSVLVLPMAAIMWKMSSVIRFKL